ncbi:Protein OSB1, mitochondrial [Linum perenne]
MIKARQLGSRFSIRNLAAFSSWSTANSRLPNFSTDEDESGDSVGVNSSSSSEVHRRAVTSKRPATVRWAPRLANSVQLIGSVERPVETIKSKTGQFGAYTILRAKNPLDSKQLTYKIMIVAWEDLAEICINHVKPGDFIYVSGLLAFYDNKDNYGSQSKIIVKELNFVDVSLYGTHPTAKKSELPNSGGLQQNDEPVTPGQAEMQVYQNHLWQAFFSNPDRWWDMRKNKKHHWSPDFIHKDTREGLWLREGVPSWVTTQLQIVDSNKPEGNIGSASQFKGYKNDLYLWQVFFHNPDEWWDNRRDKKNPRSPDFKHKDTGEALWLGRDDPPWIRKQLQRLDDESA